MAIRLYKIVAGVWGQVVSADIESIVTSRKIGFLTHFTRAVNLASILENGLVPRAKLERRVSSFVVNDAMRWDGRTNFNCTSIAFPNAHMLYSYMQADPNVKWPILLLSPRLLTEKDVLFCKHNAADRRISASPDEALQGPDALRGMFAEIPGIEARQDQKLKPCDPTDVQAEVLISGTIEPKHIMAVVFPDRATEGAFKSKLGERRTFINDRSGLYGNRGYYRKFGAGR